MNDALLRKTVKDLSLAQDALNVGTTMTLISMRALFLELIEAYASLARRMETLEKDTN